MRRITTSLFALVLALLVAQSAWAERRVALVIGNGAYKDAPLKNPVNDAKDMAGALRKLGFEVTLLTNAGMKQMDAAVRDFGVRLRQGGAGLFYYAGHGLQVAGENYLVPVDARIQTESDARYACLPAGMVLGRMDDARNDVNIIILDACRNNPFARSFRSAEQGLAKMDAPTGSLISYATAPGSVASDGDGRNGLYTQNLLKNLAIPGLPITEVFMRVRQGVVSATGRRQVPWEASSLIGQFYFAGGAGAPVPPPPAAPVPQPKQLAMGARPPQAPPASSPPGDHAAQFAQLARAGFADARDALAHAVQANPGDADARAGMAIALVMDGKLADAKYQVQRLNESGAQTPTARLAKGMVLGMAGDADADYQLKRAAEDGADRALALLCQAAAAARRSDYERGNRFMAEYGELVPPEERGAYATALAKRVDPMAPLVGAFVWKCPADSFLYGTVTLKLGFARQGARLAGGGDGTIELVSATVKLEEAQFKDGQAVLILGIKQPLTSYYSWRVTLDLSGSLDVIPVALVEYRKTEDGGTYVPSSQYLPHTSAFVRAK